MTVNKIIGCAVTVVILYAIAYCTLIGGLGYVAYHFISKIW